jgi:hypothetical protein
MAETSRKGDESQIGRGMASTIRHIILAQIALDGGAECSCCTYRLMGARLVSFLKRLASVFSAALESTTSTLISQYHSKETLIRSLLL